MRGSRLFRSRLHDQVLVTLKDGSAFAGVLFDEDGKAVIIRNAEAVGAGENKTNLPLDGEVLVLLADVAFIQRP